MICAIDNIYNIISYFSLDCRALLHCLILARSLLAGILAPVRAGRWQLRTKASRPPHASTSRVFEENWLRLNAAVKWREYVTHHPKISDPMPFLARSLWLILGSKVWIQPATSCRKSWTEWELIGQVISSSLAADSWFSVRSGSPQLSPLNWNWMVLLCEYLPTFGYSTYTVFQESSSVVESNSIHACPSPVELTKVATGPRSATLFSTRRRWKTGSAGAWRPLLQQSKTVGGLF